MLRYRLPLCAALLLLLLLPVGAGAQETPADVSSTPRTVWIVGDSLTRGLNATGEPFMFRNLLLDDLQTYYPGQVNLSFWRGICSMGRLEARWDVFEAVPRPDVVFLELGINEVIRSDECELVPDDVWAAHFGNLLDRLQVLSPDVRVVVGTVPWSGWPEGSEMRARGSVFNQWIRAEAEARGMAVADLWAATVDRPDGISSAADPNPFPPSYRGDGFHPNNAGHRRIASAFWTAYVSRYEPGGLTYLPLQVHQSRR